MAAHSGISAWSIPRTEESGQLQSLRSQGVGHNRATFTCFTFVRTISFSSKDVNFNSFFPSEVTLNYLNLEGSKNLIGI